jgi:hypothetical protein
MNYKINAVCATLFLATTSMTATAAEERESKISYDYVYAGLGSLTVDGVSGSLDLTQIGISASIGDNFVLGFSTAWNNNLTNVVDIRINQAAVGYHMPLSDNTDLQLGISSAKITANAGNYSSIAASSTAYSIGVESMLTDSTSVSFGVAGTSDASSVSTSLEINTFVTDSVSIGAGITTEDDVDLTFAGVKFHY